MCGKRPVGNEWVSCQIVIVALPSSPKIEKEKKETLSNL